MSCEKLPIGGTDYYVSVITNGQDNEIPVIDCELRGPNNKLVDRIKITYVKTKANGVTHLDARRLIGSDEQSALTISKIKQAAKQFKGQGLM